LPSTSLEIVIKASRAGDRFVARKIFCGELLELLIVELRDLVQR
jgi:hypothetical protein